MAIVVHIATHVVGILWIIVELDRESLLHGMLIILAAEEFIIDCVLKLI